MTQIPVTTINGAITPTSFPQTRTRLHYSGGSNCTFILPSDIANPDSNVLSIPNN